MPSSLIVAALAAAWLVVLVPMIARRRQEVTHIADSALASRVLHRQATCRAVLEHDVEVPMTADRMADPELDHVERQYRPGRGGYDPEAAALAARARYQFRQRVVFGLLAAAILTVGLGFVSSLFWSVHAVLDTALIGYLAYLRKQVRIEEEVRNRRAARMAGSRESYPEQRYAHPRHEQPRAERPSSEQSRSEHQRCAQPSAERQQPRYEHELDEDQPPPRRPAPPRPAHPTAVAVDLDDEDPTFDELGPAFEPRYRRAAGE